VSTLTRIDWFGDFVGFLDVGFDGGGLLRRAWLWRAARGRLPARRRALRPGDGGGCNCGRGCGRRDFDGGLAEGAFEVVERDFAGTQRTFQHLLDALRDRGGLRGNRGCGDDRYRCGCNRGGFGNRGMLAFGHLVQLLDQVFVGAFGLGLGGLEAGEDFLDAVDRGQDQRHGTGRHRHAVAEFAHQRLAGMGQRFEPVVIPGSRRCP